MRKLLNTLYLLTPESYIYVRNGAIAVKVGGEEKYTIPAHTIDAIVCFGEMSITTPLIGFCTENGITISFLSRNGHFYGRVCGPVSGNVLLRRAQYKSIDSSEFRLAFVRNILYGKLRNSKEVLQRSSRSQEDEGIKEKLSLAAQRISEDAKMLSELSDIDSLRGVEGTAAMTYFSQFDNMLKNGKYRFKTRSRRPPENEVNAVLSFSYTLLTREMQSALETVGLDPAAGYMHTLRPGRASLALDMIEELRAPLCDRFTLSLFNKGQLSDKDFDKENGAVYLNEKGRKIVLTAWQNRKYETIRHPFLEEKIEIGVIPYAQAMLLARLLRGDLDEYPPFVWR